MNDALPATVTRVNVTAGGVGALGEDDDPQAAENAQSETAASSRFMGIILVSVNSSSKKRTLARVTPTSSELARALRPEGKMVAEQDYARSVFFLATSSDDLRGTDSGGNGTIENNSPSDSFKAVAIFS